MCCPILSAAKLVINKSDSCCIVVQLWYHLYDYRLNWTPISPITSTDILIWYRGNTLKQTQTWQLNFFFIGMCYAWQHWSLSKAWSSRPLLKMLSVSQIDISLFCVCPLVDDQLHHKIVKVVVEPQAAGKWFHSKLWQCYDKIYLQ